MEWKDEMLHDVQNQQKNPLVPVYMNENVYDILLYYVSEEFFVVLIMKKKMDMFEKLMVNMDSLKSLK